MSDLFRDTLAGMAGPGPISPLPETDPGVPGGTDALGQPRETGSFFLFAIAHQFWYIIISS